MANIMFRLSSFKDFANKSGINVSRLASNGFFCKEGRIVCYACGAALDNLQRGDDAIKLHQEMSPRCPVVLNGGNEDVQPKSLPFINRSGPSVDRSNSEEDVVDAGPVKEPPTNRLSMLEEEPMGEERKSALLGPEFSAVVQSVYHRHAASQQRESKLRTVSGGGAPGHTGQPALRERQLEESSSFETILEDEITRNDSRSSEFGLTAALPNNRRTTKHRSTPLPYKVMHPEFVDESERLRSFNNVWIFDYRLCTPQQLSKAGFYYEGPEDKVRCFCCGCGLMNFQMEDEPWKEHARYYPQCHFLVEHKDPAFIRAALPQPVSVPAGAVATPTTRSWHNNVASTAAARRVPGPHRVDARDLKARMESPMVKVLLDRGYARELIRQAIESRLSHFGDDFPKIVYLLEAVYELENEYTPARFIPEPEAPAATYVPAAPTTRAAPPQGSQARPSLPTPQNLIAATAPPDLTPRTFGLPASSTAAGGSSTVDGTPSTAARTPNASLPSSTASLTFSAASNSSVSTSVVSSTGNNTNSSASKNGDKLDGTFASSTSHFGSVATAATTMLVGAAAAVMAAGAPAALAVGAAAAGAAAALAVGSAAATVTAGRSTAGTATGMASGTATGMASGTVTGMANGAATGTATGMANKVATGTATGTVAGTATGMAAGTAAGIATGMATQTVIAAGTATNDAAGKQGVVAAAAGTGAGASSGGVTASTAAVADTKKAKKKNKKKKAAAAATFAATSTTAAAVVEEPKGAEGGQDTVDANDPETQQLLEENGQLREARTCKVCLDKEVDTVFLPCGHLVCCRTCAPELRNCPVCRALIRGTVLIVLT